MKRKLSVISMLFRHVAGWALLLPLVLTGINLLWFLPNLPIGPEEVGSLLDSRSFFWSFLGVYGLLTVILCRSLCDRSGKLQYFLNRLRLPHWQIYLLHSLCNTLCYFLLFAAEGLSLFALVATACRSAQSYASFLVCWQSDLLHTFFPLTDGIGWIFLAMQTVTLGFSTSAYSVHNRAGKLSVLTFFLTAAFPVLLLLIRESGALDPTMRICGCAYCLLLGIPCVFSAWTQEVEADA